MPTPFTKERLTLRQAATFHARNQTMATEYIILRFRARLPAPPDDDHTLPKDLRQGPPLNQLERVKLVSWRNVLREDLKHSLMKGDLIAHGFLCGSLELRPISADWWRGATLDLDCNTATGHGSTIAGLVVTANAATQSKKPSEPLAPSKRPIFAPNLVRARYMLRKAEWPRDAAPPSEAEDLAAMRAAYDGPISRKIIREIRRELAPPHWRKSGPRKLK